MEAHVPPLLQKTQQQKKFSYCGIMYGIGDGAGPFLVAGWSLIKDLFGASTIWFYLGGRNKSSIK